MVKVVGPDQKWDLDLSQFSKLRPGTIRLSSVAEQIRPILHVFRSSNLCLIETKHVNGRSGHSTFATFRLGNKGLRLFGEQESTILGLDIKRKRHPVSGAIESIVHRNDSSKRFSLDPFVSLEYNGVSYQYFPREYTFSSMPDGMVSHRSGSYIDQILIGEDNIRKEYPEAVEELCLREKSIPFMWPMEYSNISHEGIQIGNIYEAASLAFIKHLREKGILEKPFTFKKEREIEEWAREFEPKSVGQKAYRTRMLNNIKKSREIRKETGQMIKETSKTIDRDMAIHRMYTAIINKAGVCQARLTEDGCYIMETNAQLLANPKYIEGGNESKHIYADKRAFRLIPSSTTEGLIYALPDDKHSGSYVVDTLLNFNLAYPDTKFVEECKVNTKLCSLVKW